MHDLSTFDILFPKFYVWILEFHFVYKNRSLDRPTWTNFALLNVDMVPLTKSWICYYRQKSDIRHPNFVRFCAQIISTFLQNNFRLMLLFLEIYKLKVTLVLVLEYIQGSFATLYNFLYFDCWECFTFHSEMVNRTIILSCCTTKQFCFNN